VWFGCTDGGWAARPTSPPPNPTPGTIIAWARPCPLTLGLLHDEDAPRRENHPKGGRIRGAHTSQPHAPPSHGIARCDVLRVNFGDLNCLWQTHLWLGPRPRNDGPACSETDRLWPPPGTLMADGAEGAPASAQEHALVQGRGTGCFRHAWASDPSQHCGPVCGVMTRSKRESTWALLFTSWNGG